MKIAVIGDLLIDETVTGRVDRVSPEAPVPVVVVEGEPTRTLGGAGNVAANLAAMMPGDRVRLLCSFSDDENINVWSLAQSAGFSVFDVGDVPAPIKRRVIARNQQLLRLDIGDRIELDDEAPGYVRCGLDTAKPDAIVIADYNKGTCTPEVVTVAMDYADEHSIPVFVDAKPGSPADRAELYDRATMRKYNRSEAGVGSVDWTDPMDIVNQTNHLNGRAPIVVVTLDRDGAYTRVRSHKEGHQTIHHPGVTNEAADVTGAGDTFLAAFVARYMQTGDPWDAPAFANVAASIAVERRGTAVVTAGEIHDRIMKREAP